MVDPTAPVRPRGIAATVQLDDVNRTAHVRLAGDAAHPGAARELMRSLQHALRTESTTAPVRAVILDLGGLDLITVDVVVALCIERRRHAAHGVDLLISLPTSVSRDQGADRLLAALGIKSGEDDPEPRAPE